MVGVVGSSPIAPTKFGRRIKHLAATPGAFSFPVGQGWGKRGLNWRGLAPPDLPIALSSRDAAVAPSAAANWARTCSMRHDFGSGASAKAPSIPVASARLKVCLKIRRRAPAAASDEWLTAICSIWQVAGECLLQTGCCRSLRPIPTAGLAETRSSTTVDSTRGCNADTRRWAMAHPEWEPNACLRRTRRAAPGPLRPVADRDADCQADAHHDAR